MDKERLGRHVLAEFYGVKFVFLDSPGFLKRSVEIAVREAKMRLRKLEYEKFYPQGITMVGILAESHIAIHTWPEKGCAAVECFTCGNEGDPRKAVQVLKERLEPTEDNIKEITR